MRAARLVRCGGWRRVVLGAGLIERITITLDRETVAWSKAQTGEDGEAGGIR